MDLHSDRGIEQILLNLKSSPLFQFSLASKELFHSNFLYWLHINYPEPCGSLFAEILPKHPVSYYPLRVYREQNNFDLFVAYPQGEVIIFENKVKSLPLESQLEAISAKIKNKEQTGFVLLSLTRPTFLRKGDTHIRLTDGTIWNYFSYQELAEKLSLICDNVANSSTYHGLLLRDYIDYIINLDRLQRFFSIDWDDTSANFFIDQDYFSQISEIRIHDLIGKMRYAQLAEQIKEHLQHEGFTLMLNGLWKANKCEVFVDFGMTNGEPLIDMKYSVVNYTETKYPIVVGVQLQGKCFRLLVEVGNATIAEKIATELWNGINNRRLWFDFEKLTILSSVEYPKKGLFNQYSQIFYYRYRKIDKATPMQLSEIIISYAKEARNSQAQLEEMIKKVL